MRMFVFGDLHGGQDGEMQYLSNVNFPEQKDLTKEDIVVQLGDFGYVWYYPESRDLYKKDIRYLNELAKRNFTLFVIPGNHENYDIINALPIIKKWGGKVYEMKLRDGIIYFAVRGEVYVINGKTFFTFSGATTGSKEGRYTYEQHISKDKFLKKKFRYGVHYKTVMERVKLKDVSLWSQELSTAEERENARMNLDKVDYKVDYVLTHTPPTFIVEEFLHRTEYTEAKFTCSTAKFLDDISHQLKFKEWYYGHCHHNYVYDDNGEKYICHYKKAPIEIIL